jgi:hypothetical protein
MSEPLEPTPVFFFYGLLFRRDIISLTDVKERIEKMPVLKWHPIDGEFDLLLDEASLTNYYQKEMGKQELLTRAYVFSDLKVKREDLVNVKLATNELEKALQQNWQMAGRVVNIDPGYLALEQVVLATCKPYGHRVYLGQGVYGELTYQFQGGHYHPLEWTYPDYCEKGVRDHFEKVRTTLKESLKSN